MLLLMYPLLFLPLFTMAETTEASMIIQERWKPQLENWRRPADWIGDGILNVAGTVLPVTRSPFDGIRGNSSSRCIYIYMFFKYVEFLSNEGRIENFRNYLYIYFQDDETASR